MTAMTDTSTPLPSLADRVRPIAAGAPVVGVHFLGKTPVFVLGEEALLFAPRRRRAPRRRACRRDPRQRRGRRAHRHRRRRRQAGRDRCRTASIAIARHRRQEALDRPGRARARTAPSPGRPARPRMCSPTRARRARSRRRRRWRGWPLRRKASALAIAHYNGVTLWFPNAAGASRRSWSGRARISASPSARTANSSSPPCRSRRCTAGGSPTPSTCACRAIRRACARCRWTAGGEFLATSGSEQLILWPFDGKDGPMGRQPQAAGALARRASRSSPAIRASRWWRSAMPTARCVLVRIDDGALIQVKAAGASPVSALGWDANGQTLAFGTEAGEAGALSF